MGTADEVLAFSRLPEDARGELLLLMGPERAADLIQALPEPLASDAFEALEPADAARILERMPSNEQADVIGELDDDDAGAIIGHLSEEDAHEMRRLVAYPDDVAGGLMVTEYLSYAVNARVAEVIEDLGTNAEEYAHYDIQYAYVTDEHGGLVGVLRMRDLLLAPRNKPLRDVMIPSPVSVGDHDPLERLVRFFDENRFFGVPVLDDTGALCGVVHRVAVETAVAEHGDRMYLSAQGIVGGEELRSMPLLLRARRRLSWLSVNIVLNMVAASVIAMHQDTLEAVIALAVFLPIISDMSGCSGNQAVAVSMRELTLGVVRPTEIARTVLAEVSVGLINGLVLGLLLGVVALVWKGNPYLGMVVGGALMLNTVVAVVIGGAVPLVLKRAKVDPAIAAGPILTTVTDMCGFFIVLTFASSMLSRLT
ncbi:MAG: magnesium transporter MgtE [Phycisphaeraceae bacterium]|nr:MAG: magnesium transporter MgtE [Phycisphaeraceae bacterium]